MGYGVPIPLKGGKMTVRCEAPDCRREIDSESSSVLVFNGVGKPDERIYFCCAKHALWRVQMAINAADRAIHDANETVIKLGAHL